jgi:hybrid cluster-associated redox disulfide protein
MDSVTGETLISDVLVSHPRAVEVFSRFGLACPGCFAASMETISAVASMHDVSIERLLMELNDENGARGQISEERP